MIAQDVACGDIELEGTTFVTADQVDTSTTGEALKQDFLEIPEIGGGPGPFQLPADHVAAFRVPKGGSSCATCLFVSEDGERCTNTYWVNWNRGDPLLPYPSDEYCSDWYVSKDGISH